MDYLLTGQLVLPRRCTEFQRSFEDLYQSDSGGDAGRNVTGAGKAWYEGGALVGRRDQQSGGNKGRMQFVGK